ncbi:MAG: hypothetical protein ACKVS5_15835 [Parvularculaceae bacterium]
MGGVGDGMLKWALRITLSILLLPVVAASVYAGWNWLQLRPDSKFVNYLEQNASAIDLTAETPFGIAQPDLDTRLILLGEVHGIRVGQDLDFELLRMLNEKTGARYYLGEFDPAQAAEFNAYLADGDENHLRRVFSFWVAENAQWANAEFMAKIRKIKALNDALPVARKISFIGMDRVQDMPLMAAHLGDILASMPESSWPGHDALASVLETDSARTENAANAPLPLAAVEAAKTLSATAPEGIEPALWKSLREQIANLSDRALVKGREAAIAASFERLAADPDFANEKLYGFWGQFHVLNATVQGSKPFVRQLQEGNTAFAGNIVSLNIINLDSRMMLPATSFGSKDPYIEIPYSLDHPLLVFVNGINDASEAAVAPLTLFKMNAEGSPYPGTNKLGAVGGVLGMMQPFVVDAPSVGPDASSQYVILAKGSAAVTPLTVADVTID